MTIDSHGRAHEWEAFLSALSAQYTVMRELGRGGMATVYLARDVRHDRPVALKVLHPDLAVVVGASRFLTEIRTTASLQHPHILPLFDSGEAAGQLYYVMPYVEGATLRSRLAREKQLPVVEAIRIATEVASALDYAHRHDVVHRDIKPENILLGDDGQALVTDFGIALAVSKAGGERMTQTGLSLGTPQYMAPEQAAAERTIDSRVDVYALGAVTYEMLAGEPPFGGPSAQVILAKLMTEQPKALTSLRHTIPAHIDSAVHAALEKIPADRFASAGAFVRALADPATERSAERVSQLRRAPVARLAKAGLLGALLAVAAIGILIGRWTQSADRGSLGADVIRIVVDADSRLRGGLDWYSAPAIAPDGRTIAYEQARADGVHMLYLRRVSDINEIAIPETEGARLPAFSPDGKWLAFESRGAIRKVATHGGSPVVVAQVPSEYGTFYGNTWLDDGTLLFGAWERGVLYRVSASGGAFTRIAAGDTSRILLNPSRLPTTQSVLVTTSTDVRVGRIGVFDLRTRKVKSFGPGTGARYVNGYIIFAGASGVLYRQRFNLKTQAPEGDSEEIATGLDVFYAALSPFDAAANGALVYRLDRGGWQTVVLDRSGKEERVLNGLIPWSPRFSPDGRKIAYSALLPGSNVDDMWVGVGFRTDLFISEVGTGSLQRLTTDGNDNNEPVWSPDGSKIAFDAGLLGTKDIFVQSLDGGSAHLLYRDAGNQFPEDWSPDGKTILFSSHNRLWALSVDGKTTAPVAATAYAGSARFSPDGRWIAYASSSSGRTEVYVQSVQNPTQRVVVSQDGGSSPKWRRDGGELYYWHGDELTAAAIDLDTNGGPAVRSRITLFQVSQSHAGGYDVSPDGRRVVIVRGTPRPNRLVIVLGGTRATSGDAETKR